jgi:RNA polymerase sigma-70 factor, ECF subfamily
MTPAVAVATTVGGVPAFRPSVRARRLDPEQIGRHVDRLYRAAWAMCGNPHDAEDLVQEACAQVLARPRWLRHDDELGYLLRALRNTHVSRLRRAGRRPSEVPLDNKSEIAAERTSFDPQTALQVSELFSTIAELPEPSRDVIVAVDVLGLSYRDAAAALGVKEATVTTRLHRARGRIADTLSSSDSGSAAASK